MQNKIQLEQEIQHKNHENVKYRNTLLDDHQKQIIKVADMKQKLHEDWAELQNAKASIFNSLKPDAFMKYEENLRQAAGKKGLVYIYSNSCISRSGYKQSRAA